MLYKNAKPVGSAPICPDVLPEREFYYRRREAHSFMAFLFAGLFCVPLVVVWPLLFFNGYPEASHPAMIGLFLFVSIMGGVSFVVGRRMLTARVCLYEDRLAVCGLYSNGSVRWDEANCFAHVEVVADKSNTMWVYYLFCETHSVRVEYSIAEPEEFIREVESRTGLILEKHPLVW